MAALLTLARPRMLPLVLLLVGCGYGLGLWEMAWDPAAGGPLLAVLVAWSLLHAGTLWLNADLDRDEGAVLFGGRAPVPDGARRAGLLALLGCVTLGMLAGPAAGRCAALAALLALLYSHPATAWKGRPMLGPLTNGVGYGVLTPLAGWSVVGAAVTGRTLAVLAVLALAMLGLSLLAQVGQGDEDRARGYRTLAARAGDAAAARGAQVAVASAGALFVGLAGVGLLPRLVLAAALPLGWVVSRLGRARDGAAAARGVLGLLGVALLAFALALVDYATHFPDGPFAGQATAVVPPPLAGRP
jgi:4-hydroxybenzoate polyprenyltransferase